MRTFQLHRNGIVAEGVQFSDGAAALHWLGQHRSTALYTSMADLRAVHCHDECTEVVWLDRVADCAPSVDLRAFVAHFNDL